MRFLVLIFALSFMAGCKKSAPPISSPEAAGRAMEDWMLGELADIESASPEARAARLAKIADKLIQLGQKVKGRIPPSAAAQLQEVMKKLKEMEEKLDKKAPAPEPLPKTSPTPPMDTPKVTAAPPVTTPSAPAAEKPPAAAVVEDPQPKLAEAQRGPGQPIQMASNSPKAPYYEPPRPDPVNEHANRLQTVVMHRMQRGKRASDEDLDRLEKQVEFQIKQKYSTEVWTTERGVTYKGSALTANPAQLALYYKELAAAKLKIAAEWIQRDNAFSAVEGYIGVQIQDYRQRPRY